MELRWWNNFMVNLTTPHDKSAQPRFLTKSRFILATECPTKLFYTGKDEYPSDKQDDLFLTTLADGGHQVGALAKLYFPDGHEVKGDYTSAEAETVALMSAENVTIFEPLIRYKNLLVRIDILVKKGNEFEIIEVKAKSYSKTKDKNFLNKKGGLASKWKSYIFDIAFQKHVLSKAFSGCVVRSHLMLVDKSVVCSKNGLNQKFRLVRDKKTPVNVTVTTTMDRSDLDSQLLIKVNTDQAVDIAYSTNVLNKTPSEYFKDNVAELAKAYENDVKIKSPIGVKCKSCEFRYLPKDDEDMQLSGFRSCWKDQLNWSDQDFKDQTVLDIWNFKKADKLINDGVIKLRDISHKDIDPEEDATVLDQSELTTKQRQWLQVQKVKDCDDSRYLASQSMREEISSWQYPLHFIDFETTSVAIPFYKGMKPYEGIAFQFSHHMLHENGQIEHAGQFLNTNRGEFPNFHFIRELRRQLGDDDGSILMYSSHENSILNTIYGQLRSSTEKDKDILCDFVRTITRSTASSDEKWVGDRAMIDMLKVVTKYYYDPVTRGQNSIKAVLPAMLNGSEFLQKKYSRPVYGSSQIPSKNFSNQVWITFENQRVANPYSKLPKMFEDISAQDENLFFAGDELSNGGMALAAYSVLQFSELGDYERLELNKALLRYCELDTWAMVAIFEGWMNMLEQSS